jgi:hypothetical protein
VIGRSSGFWEHFYPSLQRVFPEQLGSVPLEVFHRAINKVARSLIRTDADEVTYNLHIMLRFDLELQLLEGKLRVKDLPEAWRVAMQADLGVAPVDDGDSPQKTTTLPASDEGELAAVGEVKRASRRMCCRGLRRRRSRRRWSSIRRRFQNPVGVQKWTRTRPGAWRTKCRYRRARSPLAR